MIGVFYFYSMIDYLIVGSGLAGLAFAETALQHNKVIVVIDSNKFSASKVSAGIYNPVVLKRFTPVWQAEKQLSVLNDFYPQIEKKFDLQFNFKKPIFRRFFSIEEQNNWFVASDKTGLSPFMSTRLRYEKYDGISSPFDYGEVKETGYMDVASLVDNYCRFLSTHNLLRIEDFDHSLLRITSESVQYKNLHARNVVFAEGFGMCGNPYFSYLPLQGVKGELLIIKAPDLNLDVIVNTSIFILPLGQQLFKVGATYHWDDKTNEPTAEGRIELVNRLKEFLSCDFEVVSHFAGIRPTVQDRRPLVGTHSKYRNLHLLNGLGTRGVMIGPSMALALFNHIEFDEPLQPEINIKRFERI